MPPGWGLVVMTHRSISFTTSRRVEPTVIDESTQPSSSDPSTTTLGRNRRMSQPPSVSAPMIETCVRVESWKLLVGPSHRAHSEVASCSKSSAIS